MGVPPLSDPLTAVGVEAPAITSLTSPGAGARRSWPVRPMGRTEISVLNSRKLVPFDTCIVIQRASLTSDRHCHRPNIVSFKHLTYCKNLRRSYWSKFLSEGCWAFILHGKGWFLEIVEEEQCPWEGLFEQSTGQRVLLFVAVIIIKEKIRVRGSLTPRGGATRSLNEGRMSCTVKGGLL